MVLLTEDRAIFCDSGAVVVRCVAATLAHVAPISAAVCHIHIENGNPIGEIVLVKDSGKVRVDQCRAAVEARPSPRVDCATLKFEDGVRCVWALFEVQLAEVRR